MSSRTTRNNTQKNPGGGRKKGGKKSPYLREAISGGCGEQLSKREAVRPWTQNLELVFACAYTYKGEGDGRRKGEEGKTDRQKIRI